MTSVGEDVEKEESLCTIGKNAGTTTMENGIKLPQTIKNGTTLWPSNYTSGDLSE